MKVKNLPPLTIRATSLNIVARNKSLLSKLREMTLNPNSGMNYELNHLLPLSEKTDVKVNILLGHINDELIAWSLLSSEDTDFYFFRTKKTFSSKDGVMFQIFVKEKYRKMGVGRQMLKFAKYKTKGQTLCICPWDSVSDSFYNRLKNNKDIVL